MRIVVISDTHLASRATACLDNWCVVPQRPRSPGALPWARRDPRTPRRCGGALSCGSRSPRCALVVGSSAGGALFVELAEAVSRGGGRDRATPSCSCSHRAALPSDRKTD